MKKQKLTLNEEISQIKRMMKKMNEGWDSEPAYHGLSRHLDDYSDDEYTRESEKYIDEVENYIENNFSELYDKLNIEPSAETEDNVQKVTIRIKMKDGTELPREFMNVMAKEFYNADGPDAYEEILNMDNSISFHSENYLPEPDFDVPDDSDGRDYDFPDGYDGR